MKPNILLYTLGNVRVNSNTAFCFENARPDPYTNQRSQELYDALSMVFNIRAWACGRHGSSNYLPAEIQTYSKELQYRINNTPQLSYDLSIQMAGHPVYKHPKPSFIIIDFIPYADLKAMDSIAFPYFKITYERMQDFLYHEARGIICYTPVQRYLLINWLKMDPCKVTSICSGVNGFVPKEYVKKRTKTILWVGSNFERKAGNDVLKVFSKLYAEDHEYRLNMVGIDMDIDIPGVTVMPFLHGDQLRHLDTLYKEASVFVLPSYKENLGLVYLEAMARKTPVVVTSRGGMAEMVRRTLAGKVVVPGEIDSIVSAIQTILSDDDVFRGYSERAYEFASKNAQWSIASARIFDAVNRWMNNQPVPDDYNDYSISDQYLPYQSIESEGIQ